MEKVSDRSNGAVFGKDADSNSKPPSSCPSMTSSLTSLSSTPNSMERDQSTDEAGSSEPVNESPVQEYFLPNHQDDFKLAVDVSNQVVLGDEPPSESPAQQHLLPNHQKGLNLESDVLNQVSPGHKPPSEPRAQEHIVSESQEGQNSSDAAAAHRAIDHEDSQATISVPPSPTSRPVNMVLEGSYDDQAAVSVPPNPTSRPVNMVLEEYSYSPQPDGLWQKSREQPPTAGLLQSQQPQLGKLNESSGHSWQANDVSQTEDTSARDSSSVKDQRMAESEVTYPKYSYLGTVLQQAPQNNAPGTTIGTFSQQRSPPAPLQMAAPPSSQIPSCHSGQERHLPSIDNISRPPNTELVDRRIDRWSWQRNLPYSGYLPHPNEGRRFEAQTPRGWPRRLVQGPTRPLGPPLKPLDGLGSEAIAQERWRITRRD